MEEHNVAEFPRPVHHRIPNFKNAELAAQRLSQLPEFQQAKTVKVCSNGLVAGSGGSQALWEPRLGLHDGFTDDETRAS
eukprot:355993-Chlamydomonas_euryale.AAC.3